MTPGKRYFVLILSFSITKRKVLKLFIQHLLVFQVLYEPLSLLGYAVLVLVVI